MAAADTGSEWLQPVGCLLRPSLQRGTGSTAMIVSGRTYAYVSISANHLPSTAARSRATYLQARVEG
eukprot:SAG22_NODE_18052_length_294_cov_0.789744_1_plen_66_part_10